MTCQPCQKSTDTFHIVIEEQCDFTTVFNYTNFSTGLPNDLTGYRADMQIRSMYNGNFSCNVVQLDLTSDTNGGIVLGGTAGTVTVTITNEQISNLLWDQGVYTLILINPQGNRTLLSKGFVTIPNNPTLITNSTLVNVIQSPVTHPNNLGPGGVDGTGVAP